jgi:hypothetical protein
MEKNKILELSLKSLFFFNKIIIQNSLVRFKELGKKFENSTNNILAPTVSQ